MRWAPASFATYAESVVLVLGMAGLIADGFAMGAGNYSGTKAETDLFKHLLTVEKRRVALAPGGEREEVRQIFARKGFSGPDLERIVNVIPSDEDSLDAYHGGGRVRVLSGR